MGTCMDRVSDDGKFKKLAISLEERGLKGNTNLLNSDF